MQRALHQKRLRTLNHGTARNQRADYSALVIIGAILALALLSGCASTSVGGSSDTSEYNPNTGYPAVGGMAWQ